MIWYRSDDHYGHDRPFLLKDRNFNTIQEMNECLIENHNSLVHPTDTVIFLGDVFFLPWEESKKILSRMNGKVKVLVRGNHDHAPNAMFKLGFHFVCERMQMKIGKSVVNLSHYPYRYNAWNQFVHTWIKWKKQPRGLDKRMVEDGNFLIHGHTHENTQVNKERRMIHVGLDAWNLKPVSIEKISQLIDKNR